MANYTFDIFKYKLVTENGVTVKSLTEKCKPLTVESTNYIAATFKVEKRYRCGNMSCRHIRVLA